jgi:hypothetical protein
MSRPLAVALSILPGWGHLYLGRELQGLLVFTFSSMTGFLLVNAWLLHLGTFRQAVTTISSLLFLTGCVYSVVDIWRLTSPRRVERMRRLCDVLLWEGMMNYVRHEDLAAEEKFLQCWRLDRLDVEPIVRAGVVAARRQAFEEARRLLGRARRLDSELKWRAEIDRELEMIRVASRSTPSLAVSPPSSGSVTAAEERKSA